MSINYGVTGVLFLGVLIGWLFLELPDVDLVPLLVTSLLICLLVPLIFYPFAKTIWACIDLLLHGGRAGDSGEGEPEQG